MLFGVTMEANGGENGGCWARMEAAGRLKKRR